MRAIVALLVLVALAEAKNLANETKTTVVNLDNHVRFLHEGDLYYNAEIQHFVMELDIGVIEDDLTQCIAFTKDEKFRAADKGRSRWTERFIPLQRSFNISKLILGEEVCTCYVYHRLRMELNWVAPVEVLPLVPIELRHK